MNCTRLLGRPSLTAAVLLTLAACGRSAPPPPAAPAPQMPEPEVLLEEGPEIVEEEALPEVTRDLLGGAAYDLPVEANTWVEAELDYLINERHAVIGRWLDRADFYEEYVKTTLAMYGLPTDLHHLAMIESGYLPTVRSRSGAVGIWQFMKPTGRQLGLRVDDLVDERMDPVRSTHAAARHLRSLHRTLGDWALAAAAYNAGSGRVTRGMQGVGAKNFWELAVWGDLADETKHYVPRLYAVTIIGRDRTRFGYPERNVRGASFAYDSVRVDHATPLTELSQMSGVATEQLAALNPHLFRGTTPPGQYWVWVPAGSGPSVQEAYLASDFRKQQGYGTYTVRHGDHLGKLAERSGAKASKIRELNPKVNWDKLRTGQKLKLPYTAAQMLAARAPEKSKAENNTAKAEASLPKRAGTNEKKENARVAEHVVKPGETLWGIAHRYAVSVSAIREANELGGSTIVPGKTLRIPQETRVAASHSERNASADGEPGKTKSAPEKSEKSESQRARHVVKNGDTLWSIAREYGSSVAAIQDANRIEGAAIVPGQKLLIPR